MSLLKQTMRAFDIDAIYGLDYETHWSKDFTLKKIPTTEYVTDPRFEAQIVSVRKDSWTAPRVMEMGEFIVWARTVDWSRCGILAHNTAFDALIASYRHGIEAKAYFDTMSMARPIMPVTVGRSLVALCAAFGRKSKMHADALHSTQGKRWHEFTADEKRRLKKYAGEDIDDCWFLFERFLPHLPLTELKLIDVTMRMYCQPTLLLDRPLLLKIAVDTRERKAKLLTQLNADKSVFMSNDKFAALLISLGVEPPMKISKTTNEPTFAFSKQDLEFKELLEHDDEMVVAAVETRLGVKSTQTETRADRLAMRAERFGPQPIALNYCGAKTLRWSGTDRMNWQNLKRGSEMRTAICAPPGHSLVIADSSQIEARLVAWFNGQRNIVNAFANGEDVYAITASDVYGRKITKETAPEERFVGKVCVLSLGFQAGAGRFAHTLRTGAMGPVVKITDQLAIDTVRAWRQANPFIVAGWKRVNNNAKSAFGGRQRIADGPVVFEGQEGRGMIHLPGGTYMRYDLLEIDEEGMSYATHYRASKDGTGGAKRKRLYGGLFMENIAQALARQVVAEQILIVLDEMKMARVAMMTHDEGVFVVPDRYAKKVLQCATKVMHTAPAWAAGLPVACEAHISKRYDK